MNTVLSSEILELLLDSWEREEQGVHSNSEILDWYRSRQAQIFVDIQPSSIEASSFWFYDRGRDCVRNAKDAFFSIAGLKGRRADGERFEQPILLQNEIGFLGFLCARIQGVLHFLVQAKIEPGNLNNVQLSPTIQATRSNFTQLHGGKQPAYLDYFVRAGEQRILVDQIQSEQSSRFLGKRNRNIVVLLEERAAPEEGKNFRWLTLGQIKRLMRRDNMVNMDTRTVLSCLPYTWLGPAFEPSMGPSDADPGLLQSLFLSPVDSARLALAFHAYNNMKMFDGEKPELCGLSKLAHWSWRENCFVSDTEADFKVIFCRITIEGREVRSWDQPLFAAAGPALFALACRTDSERGYEFLVRTKREVGCFDVVEFGPTVQLEYRERGKPVGAWDELILRKIQAGEDLICQTRLSEEGGRFYHEENDNIIVRVSDAERAGMPAEKDGYFWLTLHELVALNMVNNVLNIQLRNLISLLELRMKGGGEKL